MIQLSSTSGDDIRGSREPKIGRREEKEPTLDFRSFFRLHVDKQMLWLCV